MPHDAPIRARDYQDDDFPTCLAVFDSNVPGFFHRTTGFYEKMGFRLVQVVPDGFAPGFDLCEMRRPAS